MNQSTLKQAIDKYGVDAQILQAVEELNELATALMHYRKGKAAHKQVVEEIADCKIMCGQLRLIFGENLTDDAEDYKMERLAKRLRE